MGKILNDPREKIVQRSVGFNFRQIEFLNWCEKQGNGFKPDKHARRILDDQIALINPEFLNKEDERRKNE